MPNQIRAAVRVVFDLKIGVLCGFFKSHPSDGLMLWVYWGLLGFIGFYYKGLQRNENRISVCFDA